MPVTKNLSTSVKDLSHATYHTLVDGPLTDSLIPTLPSLLCDSQGDVVRDPRPKGIPYHSRANVVQHTSNPVARSNTTIKSFSSAIYNP